MDYEQINKIFNFDSCLEEAIYEVLDENLADGIKVKLNEKNQAYHVDLNNQPILVNGVIPYTNIPDKHIPIYKKYYNERTGY